MEEPKHIYCDMRAGDPAHPGKQETTGDVPQLKLPEQATPVSQNRCHQNTNKVVLMIVVVILAILSTVFIVFYFTVEKEGKSCVGKDSLVKKESKESNESEENSTVVSTAVVSPATNQTNNETTKVLERYSLRFKGNNINDYVQTIGVPVMTEMTVSFFLKTNQSSDGYLVSYAVPGKDNEFLIFFEANSMKVLLMHSKNSSQGTSISFDNIKINDGRWHHVGFMWQSNTGAYSVYKDRVLSGRGTASYTINKSLSGNGTWVLGLDQDSVGGGFNPNEDFQGEIAELNIWDKVLSKPENSALLAELLKGCKSTLTGNVKAWNDFISGVKGDVKVLKSTYC